MKNNQSQTSANSSRPSKLRKDPNLSESNRESLDKLKEEYIKKIQNMNYDTSMKLLDGILQQLQDESIEVEDIQKSYIKGQLYLEHCEKLLEEIEQEVIQLDPGN